jgi:membrane-associated phospholipid phosphatase
MAVDTVGRRALVVGGLFSAMSLAVGAQVWRGVDAWVLDGLFVGQPLSLMLLSDLLGTYLWVGLAAYLLWRRRWAGVGVVGGLLGAMLLAQLIRAAIPWLYFQAPPAREGAVTVGLFGGLGSYPSGHTARAFAGAMAVFGTIGATRFLWWALAALTGVTRLLLGVHFLSDVVGGALLGVLAGLIVPPLAARLLPSRERSR